MDNLGSKQSIHEIWPVHVILQKKNVHQKIMQKLRPENYSQALLCLQSMNLFISYT